MTKIVEPRMRTAQARHVMDSLQQYADRPSADVARFVGGCVRNALIGKIIDDVDIATVLTPEQVTDALQMAGNIEVIPTGIEHGTVTAVVRLPGMDTDTFEITTLRKDVETDGRRATIAYTDKWEEDAERRDFTVNAIYADVDGRLYDYFGGVADAAAGVIRFVGDAETRIREDYLRILRFFRFHAWYGNGELDAHGLSMCALHQSGLQTLSAERIAKELLKTLAAPEPRPVVRMMAATGILSKFLPVTRGLQAFNTMVDNDQRYLQAADGVLRLTALLPDDRRSIEDAARKLKLSNDDRNRMLATVNVFAHVDHTLSPAAACKAIYTLGADVYRDTIRMAWATAPKQNDRDWQRLLAVASVWPVPKFPLSGNDVMEMGVPKGPLVGRALSLVGTWWIDAGFPDDRDSIMEKLRLVTDMS